MNYQLAGKKLHSFGVFFMLTKRVVLALLHVFAELPEADTSLPLLFIV